MVMETQVQVTRKITLIMDEEEAIWLMNKMQNPCPPVESLEEEVRWII